MAFYCFRKDRGYVDTVESLVINDPAARVNACASLAKFQHTVYSRGQTQQGVVIFYAV